MFYQEKRIRTDTQKSLWYNMVLPEVLGNSVAATGSSLKLLGLISKFGSRSLNVKKIHSSTEWRLFCYNRHVAHACDPRAQQAEEEDWKVRLKISLDYEVPGQMYICVHRYVCARVQVYVCKKSRQQLEISILPNPSMNYKSSHEIRTLIS